MLMVESSCPDGYREIYIRQDLINYLDFFSLYILSIHFIG